MLLLAEDCGACSSDALGSSPASSPYRRARANSTDSARVGELVRRGSAAWNASRTPPLPPIHPRSRLRLMNIRRFHSAVGRKSMS